MQQGGAVDLKTALTEADLWQKAVPEDAWAQRLATTPTLDQDAPPHAAEAHVETKSKPAKWRARPLFIFPWIGADDALGTQYGAVSVPLMDHLQNETVRATFLYGAASHFPYQEVALTSTRYTPTINLALYRQQTFNGQFYRPTASGETELENSYLDEKGARLETNVDKHMIGGVASFGLAIKYAHLKPYIGPEINGHGWLVEPGANAGIIHRFGRFTWSNALQGRVAPESLNEEFDYNQVGASTNLSLALPVLDLTTSIGVEGSRTRGKKRRDFQEVYRPLRTFVPGSGGGYNQNSFPLVDADGLFAAVYGNTQGRAKATATLPLIPDFDKQIWIVYIERLDFTAFYNYGAAWNGPEPKRGWDRLIRAHGYNLDLQFENKGVRFNAGLGTGQVIGNDWELYVTTGFDALF